MNFGIEFGFGFGFGCLVFFEQVNINLTPG